ncbi:MAG: hypothetical protein P4L49_19475 [Desulfosporosinus sp.]|nr:hypothetical protein [Desulfosporosinus sp.]
MKKLGKKVMAIVGTATLAVGLMALPALAGTAQAQRNGWVGQMQNFMQQTFNTQSSVPTSANEMPLNSESGSSPYGYGMMGGFTGTTDNGGYGMMGSYSGTSSSNSSNGGYGMMGAR